MPRLATAVAALAACVAAVVLASGCEDPIYVIDPYPVTLNFSNGVPELTACPTAVAACDTPFDAVIDTGAPLTLIDPGLAVGTLPRRQDTQLDLRSPGDGLITRVRWLSVNAIVTPIGALGTQGGLMSNPKVILGGDALGVLAMRLDATHKQAFFFPNIAGSSDVLGRSCLAVIPSAPRGGGAMVLPDGPTTFPATREVVSTCLAPDQPADVQSPITGAGANALMVVSTGLPVTILSKSAYERARAFIKPRPLAYDDIPMADWRALHLPGLPGQTISVRPAIIPAWALVASEPGARRGPCSELLASRTMALGGCDPNDDACFCRDTDTQPCRSGAAIELRAPLDVLLVDDADPFLQSVRAELRPSSGDIDGFLGMNALRSMVVDFDYPGARLIVHCGDPTSPACATRPRVTNTTSSFDELKTRCNLPATVYVGHSQP